MQKHGKDNKNKNRVKELLQKKHIDLSKYENNIESIIEELHIHEIELELQNQELQKYIQKLEKEQNKYKSLYMNAPVAYFTLNNTGNIIELNHASANLLELPLSSFKYKSIFSFLEQESKQKFTQFLKHAFETEKIINEDVVFIDANQNHVFANISSVRFFEEEIEQNVIRCTISDINKIKSFKKEGSLNKKLLEKQYMLNAMFDESDVVMLFIDANTKNIENANKAAEKFYGYTIEQLKSMKISDLNQIDTHKLEKELLAVKNNEKKYFQFKHKLADGTIKHVEVYSNPISFKNKHKLFSIIHDITEKEETKSELNIVNNELATTIEELNNSNSELIAINEDLHQKNLIINKEREQFLMLLNAIPSSIYIADFETSEILFVNKAKEKIFGKNLVGKPCYKVFYNFDKECEFCQKDFIIKNKENIFEWENYNPLIDRHFKNIEKLILWHNNKLAKFQISFDLTDILKSKNELEKLSIAVKQSPATIVITDTEANIEYVNPKFTNLTGYTFEEAIGKNPRILNSGKTDKKIFNDLWQTITKGKIWRGEFINKKKNGEEFFEKAIISPIFDDNSKIINYIAIKEDITNRKEIENTLKEREILLNQTGALAKVGGWKIDLNTNELTWTKEVFHIHEKLDFKQPTVEEAIAYYDKESLPVIQKAVNDIIEKNKSFDLELNIITEKGNKRQVRALGEAIKNKNGTIESIIGTFQDISLMKQKEAELAKINKDYKQLFDFMPIGISIADNTGQLIENNHEAERLLGLSKKEHNKRTIDGEQWQIIRRDGSLMPPDEFASVLALKHKKLIENVEMGIKKSADDISWINVSAVPSITGEGLVISYTDITEKINRENNLLQYTKQLKNANATKDKFLDIIAHDLKNPFNSIIGFSDLLIKNYHKYDDDKIQNFIKLIQKAGTSTFKLLENLLEWSRAQTGKIEYKPMHLNFNNILKEVLLNVEDLASQKNIIITHDININNVYADKNMLKTILRNLFTNAIKFTHLGGAIIITANKKEKHHIISIIDTGIGISKEKIGKLFKISEKNTTSGTENEKGTGLGLLLCKEFIEKHNGKIQVESEEGKGSEFSIFLPIVNN